MNNFIVSIFVFFIFSLGAGFEEAECRDFEGALEQDTTWVVTWDLVDIEPASCPNIMTSSVDEYGIVTYGIPCMAYHTKKVVTPMSKDFFIEAEADLFIEKMPKAMRFDFTSYCENPKKTFRINRRSEEAERPDTTASVGFNNRVIYRVFTREDMVEIKPDSLKLDSLVQSWLEEFE